MAEDPRHIHYSDEDLFNPETHHEESDVNVRALLWFFVIFVVISVITHFALTALYKGMSKMEKARGGETLTQMPRAADANVPKGQPLLQPFPTKRNRGVSQLRSVGGSTSRFAPYPTTLTLDASIA